MKSDITNPFVEKEIRDTWSNKPTISVVLSETYSQCYEDAIIDGIIRAHCMVNNIPESSIRNLFTYLEIGANHPIACSSTYYFRKKYQIDGVLVEANPKLIPELYRVRPTDTIHNCAVVDDNRSHVNFYVCPESEISSLDEEFVKKWKDGKLGIENEIKVAAVTANKLLKEFDTSNRLVFLSIDVEGYDMKILRSIDFTEHRPFIVQLEPSDHYRPGTSLEMTKFMLDADYELVCMTDVNLIFKRR